VFELSFHRLSPGIGAGRALIAAAVDCAASEGAASVHLAVRASNSAAVAVD